MTYADKPLTCRDCRSTFTFTAGEQEFHAAKGFATEPGRCPDCRATRRQERSDGGSYSSYGGQRELFTATCASCGNEARVPFQPRGDKPVYCSDCFRSQGSSDRAGSGAGRQSWSSRW